MMIIYKSLSIISVFIFISCNQNAEKNSLTEKKETLETSNTENKNIEPKVEVNKSIESFKEFRNAVYKKNKVKVKTFFNFPIYNENNEIWYLEGIANEKNLKKITDKIIPFTETEFDKHYDKIFTTYFVNSILKIKSEILFNTGEYETIEQTEKQTKYKIYATYDKEKNEIILNLATETPIKFNDGENDLIENAEYNVIYYFKIENDKNLKFKQIRIAG
jgi:hypothetical protein